MPLEHYFTNNTNLKSEIRTLTYSYENTPFEFFSDNGVFAKNKIDYASKLLVETFIENHKEVEKECTFRCWVWLWFFRNRCR